LSSILKQYGCLLYLIMIGMDDLGTLLAGYRFEEPPQIEQIKAYVLEHLGVQSTIALRGDQFIVTVPDSASAGRLRMHGYAIEKKYSLPKRLIIRIGK
jgi:hypothetical protein